MKTEELVAFLTPMYHEVRVLPDGTVAATVDLMYTRAICLGLNEWSWEARFCFEDRALATQRLHELQSEDDIPEGAIARREKS